MQTSPDGKRIRPGRLDVPNAVIPRLWTLRHIPGRYRHLLPVSVMKRYQCVVVGGERGILTVAITRPENTAILGALSTLTGCTIFPVLVEPARMRLLIRRIERLERSHYAPVSRLSLYTVLQQRSMLLFILAYYPKYFEK